MSEYQRLNGLLELAHQEAEKKRVELEQLDDSYRAGDRRVTLAAVVVASDRWRKARRQVTETERAMRNFMNGRCA